MCLSRVSFPPYNYLAVSQLQHPQWTDLNQELNHQAGNLGLNNRFYLFFAVVSYASDFLKEKLAFMGWLPLEHLDL